MKIEITKSVDVYEIRSDKRHFIYKATPKSEDQAFVAFKHGKEVLRLSVDVLNEMSPDPSIESKMIAAVLYYVSEIRECTNCKEDQHDSKFTVIKRKLKDGSTKIYETSFCKKCSRKSGKDWEDRNKYFKFWSCYRLGQQAVDELMSKGCAICGSFDNLRIDHDHECCPGIRGCGKCVRGVLCAKHNTALGLLGDSVEVCLNAIDYLRNADSNKKRIQDLNKNAVRPVAEKKLRKKKQ